MGLCIGGVGLSENRISLSYELEAHSFADEEMIANLGAGSSPRFSVCGRQVNTVFRHELGHAALFDHVLKEYRLNLDEEYDIIFERGLVRVPIWKNTDPACWDEHGADWLRVHSCLDKNLINDSVSYYAAVGGPFECFAEMFVIFSSPCFEDGCLNHALGEDVEAPMETILQTGSS